MPTQHASTLLPSAAAAGIASLFSTLATLIKTTLTLGLLLLWLVLHARVKRKLRTAPKMGPSSSFSFSSTSKSAFGHSTRSSRSLRSNPPPPPPPPGGTRRLSSLSTRSTGRSNAAPPPPSMPNPVRRRTYRPRAMRPPRGGRMGVPAPRVQLPPRTSSSGNLIRLRDGSFRFPGSGQPPSMLHNNMRAMLANNRGGMRRKRGGMIGGSSMRKVLASGGGIGSKPVPIKFTVGAEVAATKIVQQADTAPEPPMVTVVANVLDPSAADAITPNIVITGIQQAVPLNV